MSGTSDFTGAIPLAWRLMGQADAPAIHALHAQVAARTPPGMVRPDGLEHFQQHIAQRGRILGCFADGDLVAYGVLGMDSETVDHLAALLDLDAAQRARLCVLDGAACLPEWRGRRLHCAAIEERMALGRELGRTLVAATVAPENMRSLRGLLAEGFSVQGYAIVYGGLARLIVQRDLLLPARQWRTLRSVPSADHAGHKQALADQLQGAHCWQDHDGRWFVDYGRPA